MNRLSCRSIILFTAICCIPCSLTFGQLSGSRGGVGRGAVNQLGQPNQLAVLAPEVVQGYITIDGKAEVRVKPTEIRIVLAVTGEGKTPGDCQNLVETKVETLRDAWIKMGVAAENIVDDFIAVLPRYEFHLEQYQDRKVAMEKKAGYLMQTNLHVAVKNDAEAMKVINVAFDNDVADIIAFDYWSNELDALKVKARAQAVKAAREKSDVLLGALFEEKPAIINVQEATTLHYPESLYESFENTHDERYSSGFLSRDTPVIRTFRPKNTYYRGLYTDGDIQAKDLPMRSEISIVSTVRLYFESPVAKEFQENANDKD